MRRNRVSLACLHGQSPLAPVPLAIRATAIPEIRKGIVAVPASHTAAATSTSNFRGPYSTAVTGIDETDLGFSGREVNKKTYEMTCTSVRSISLRARRRLLLGLP